MTNALQLCTTAFLVEISQYIKFGDLTTGEETMPAILDSEHVLPPQTPITMPSIGADNFTTGDSVARLSDENEDMLLKVRPLESPLYCTTSERWQDTTSSFADWVASFIRRVIQLLENLPDEGLNGSAQASTEG